MAVGVRDDDVKEDARDGGRGPGDRLRGAGNWLIGRPWVGIAIIALVIFGFWVKGTRTQPHEVKVVFSEAVSVYSGLDVRVDGLDAGKVKGVKNEDGLAVVTIGIKDDKVWPLHRGTKAALRFGSTIGNGTRQIEIIQGPASAPEIPDGGVIPNADSIETTEFDDVFDTFNKRTRAALQGTLKSTGDTFAPRQKQLRAAVEDTPKGLGSLAGLTGDLSADQPALRAFVVNTDRVTRTLQSRKAALSDLVGVASQTMRAFAANTTGIQNSLDRFPGTVREARTTLGRLDTSVDHLDGLVKDLKPGATQLGLLSRDLRPALADLRKTVPTAVSTFRTGQQAAPQITELLKKVQPFSDKLAPTLTRFAPQLGCLRPYAPDIAALMVHWTSFNQPYDKDGHLGRIWGNAGAAGFTSNPLNSEEYTKLSGQGYAFIRPPGLDTGTPYFMPECGITASVLDPKNDPEGKR